MSAIAKSFDQGYCHAIMGVRVSEGLILDSVSDGILAHDMKRRIVFINRAAEKITGVRRQQALGRDCHEVFGEHLCGSHCIFGDIGPDHFPLPSNRASGMEIDNGWHGGRKGMSVDSVRAALLRCRGNKVRTARILGTSRATLYRYFKDHPEVLD